MRPIILYRDYDFSVDEIAAARPYFDLTNTRMQIKKDDLVIGRYSVLPFYREQARDVMMAGATLINSYEEHLYAADIRKWYADLSVPTPFAAMLTPRTWMSSEELMADTSCDGPFVVKGITNSKKHSWNTHMFAQTKRDAIEVMLRLQEDSLIGQQPIVFRRFIPLKAYDIAVNGMPIGYEWRFFIAYGEVLCGAWYWSSYIREDVEPPPATRVPAAFLGEVCRRIGSKINFVVVDVAETADGEFMVVELNDGQMSGPSENNLGELYRSLHQTVTKKWSAR
jgi:hypothetical protein